MYRFKDFKGFADASLDLSRPLTVLIGKNGSGKSNAVEGIELLSQIAHGRPLNEITDVGRGAGEWGAGAFEVRGGLRGCARAGRDAFLLERSDGGFTYTVQVRARPEPHIAFERALAGPTTLFTTVDAPANSPAGELKVHVREGRQSARDTTTFPANRSVLSQLDLAAPQLEREYTLRPKRTRAAEPRGRAASSAQWPQNISSAIRAALASPIVLNPDPRAMRAYDRIGNRALARNGANVSAALYALKSGDAGGKASLSRILGWIKQLLEEPFTEIGFVTTELDDVVFGLREAKGGPLLDARVLSDGTLRSLAVLTALETAPEGARVIIEEFDSGLHPGRVGVFTQAIWECSARRRLNVLVTTHTPATLDSLTKEQLDGVVVSFWDNHQRASRLVPLLELPRADALLEQGRLGDLVTRGALDPRLAPGPEEPRARKARGT